MLLRDEHCDHGYWLGHWMKVDAIYDGFVWLLCKISHREHGCALRRQLWRSDNVFTFVLSRINGVVYFSEGIRKPFSYTFKEKAEWKSASNEMDPLCLLSISIETDGRKM